MTRTCSLSFAVL